MSRFRIRASRAWSLRSTWISTVAVFVAVLAASAHLLRIREFREGVALVARRLRRAI